MKGNKVVISSKLQNFLASDERKDNYIEKPLEKMIEKNLEKEKEKEKMNPKKSNYTYTAERVVGNGSFGVVYQAHVIETGELVAIKKVYQDKRYKNRELQIFRELHHPNIIQLKTAFYTKGEKADEIYLNLVMEYMPETSYRILKQHMKNKTSIPNLAVKLYVYQLTRAIIYLNYLGIAHRDVKPQNLLIDPSTHLLKLCDFGSAKKLIPGENNVSYICSRYYRAPELIFGATDYTGQIDVWSIGCVMGELILGHPLFPGESGVDQLVEIIKILGTPTKEQIRSINPNYNEFKFPSIKAHSWSKLFKEKASSEEVDLISKILVYEPNKRFTALQIIAHPCFNELREEKTTLPGGGSLPDLFNFTKEELATSPDLMSQLIPSWYRKKHSKK